MRARYVPLAICYDFDGTLSPGYMQDFNFIPALAMKPIDVWKEVKELAQKQQGDEILIYMGQMLKKADSADVQVTKRAFADFGSTVELFKGVSSWFKRIERYGRSKKVRVQHFMISSGLREMIAGTSISE